MPGAGCQSGEGDALQASAISSLRSEQVVAALGETQAVDLADAMLNSPDPGDIEALDELLLLVDVERHQAKVFEGGLSELRLVGIHRSGVPRCFNQRHGARHESIECPSWEPFELALPRGTPRYRSLTIGPAGDDMVGGNELPCALLSDRLYRALEPRVGVGHCAELPEVQHIPKALEAPNLVSCVQRIVVFTEELLVPL
jgi:hypothetical protein